EGYTEEFICLRDYLTAAELGRRTVYTLTLLGEVIVPYCDDHAIPIDGYLNQHDYPKLVDTFPYMRKRIAEAAQPEEIQAILDDVRRSPTRDAIRFKYRLGVPKKPLGKGTVNHLKESKAVMTIYFDDQGAVAELVPKLSGVVDWTLVATTLEHPSSVEVSILYT
ncbi:MAG: hypothetical protein MUQ10_10915, partial [Anaerolineae bacterium]|nr:hypothetical protein [Anaerolineae bacterium]